MIEGRLMTPREARSIISYLNMEPMVDLRVCGGCGEKQDAMRCKQRALPQGMLWRCGYCGTFNNWKVQKKLVKALSHEV